MPALLVSLVVYLGPTGLVLEADQAHRSLNPFWREGGFAEL
jgi:hypothetical protein